VRRIAADATVARAEPSVAEKASRTIRMPAAILAITFQAVSAVLASGKSGLNARPAKTYPRYPGG
jgi:hypothetical protein